VTVAAVFSMSLVVVGKNPVLVFVAPFWWWWCSRRTCDGRGEDNFNDHQYVDSSAI
jgi:hypothetical protein